MEKRKHLFQNPYQQKVNNTFCPPDDGSWNRDGRRCGSHGSLCVCALTADGTWRYAGLKIRLFVISIASVTITISPLSFSSLSQLPQEEGDRKTNLIVNYLPQTMTQVRRSPSSKVRFSPIWVWSFHSYVKAIRRKGINEIIPLEQPAVLVKCCGKESHKIQILP